MVAAVLNAVDRVLPAIGRVALVRILAIVGLLAAWEGLARSGWFYDGVVTSLVPVAEALAGVILGKGEFYRHLGVSTGEIAVAVLVGGFAGIAVGIVFGASKSIGRLLEPFLYYIAPTPKIVFLPILIAAFGVGVGSKMAVGALSAFFPLAMSTAAGMREINPVLINVGRSFNLRSWQMVRYVYLPSLVLPVTSGLRLGLGLAIIGVLLSETKLSNQGIGFLAIQYYNLFRIPELYAVLIVTFGLAGLSNALIGALERRAWRAPRS